MLENHDCIHATKAWIERVVIGLNLCPFAKPVFDSGGIRYLVLSNMDFTAARQEFVRELAYLNSDSAFETSIIIFPTRDLDFNGYLNFIDAWNLEIDALDYRGVFQLASFHPEYQFEGLSILDPANFTNRSPLPMVHILREFSIEQALRKYSRPELIPEANIMRTRSLGLAQMRLLLDECNSLIS